MPRLMRRTLLLIAVLLPLMGLALQPAITTAAPDPPPFTCPEGWDPVERPVNLVLRCLPNNIAASGHTEPANPPPFLAQDDPFGCPEGWSRVVHPVNPALGCLPDNVTAPDGGG